MSAPKFLAPYRPLWAAAVAVVSGLLLAAEHLLTVDAILGMPVRRLEALSVLVFMAMIAVMFHRNAHPDTQSPNPLTVLPDSPRVPLPAPLPALAMPASPSFSSDGRSWLRESASEISKHMASVPPLKRKAIAAALYVNRWVRWKGKVADIKDTMGEFYIAAELAGGQFATLNFGKDDLPLLENLRKGDVIEFEGQIKKVMDSGFADIYSVRFL